MLETYLENALKELDILIALTQEDISLIKEADHASLSEKLNQKKHALTTFESTKVALNKELLSLSKESESSLEEVLTKTQSTLLEAFKIKLQTLKDVNLRYSKLLIPVNEFYGTLFNSMFAFDSNGYQRTTPMPAAMLKVSA